MPSYLSRYRDTRPTAYRCSNVIPRRQRSRFLCKQMSAGVHPCWGAGASPCLLFFAAVRQAIDRHAGPVAAVAYDEAGIEFVLVPVPYRRRPLGSRCPFVFF
jgi:hypothetical protein